MGSLGFGEILLILVVALLLFGPKKLPELGKAAGRTLREFKNATRGMMEEDDDKAAAKKTEEQARP
ncbi:MULTISPECIES: twin-arginine translocase TatA/TatE family subunit [Bacillaceae]|uniref:Sec-independent protein translocase protein TatA n=2 Tax=Metabacillus TaxID=2675233 RepID=A0ABS5LJC0_9BACI|nr:MULTISPECIES: twin-arginine translocase TatA/TatE family subunit [Bacillaceae]KZZ82557.1 preprotein translocase subunit TatA [Bacillus sp. SJS]MBS2970459.1 twin-arginine translocase TatA/TatE family subunit [Metabacillus flavus]